MAAPDDVDMNAPAPAGPTLAADDPHTWAKVGNLVLRHFAREPNPLAPPEGMWRNKSNAAPPRILVEARINHPFVNLDAHIPRAVRVPKTASVVDQTIARVCGRFARRPSDYYVAQSQTWVCPKHDCVYTILLEDLTPAQHEVVDVATVGIREPFVAVVEGRHVVLPAFVREVIDIVALSHYENTHLQGRGFRHILHGQDVDGRIQYHWEPVRIQHHLTSTAAGGWEIRYHEEHRRLETQRALAAEARAWASELIRYLDDVDRDEARKARNSYHRFVVDRCDDLVNLDRSDGLFDAHASLFDGGRASVQLASRTNAAMKEAHSVVYDGHRTITSEHAARQRVRARAQAEMEYWINGEGAHRLVKRPNVRNLYT
ncbi:unnamed protein product [Peniophora sp. CBMAI 1063]|nr:unnamed protein product [Peniophora sp. CBMAI 1063]